MIGGWPLVAFQNSLEYLFRQAKEDHYSYGNPKIYHKIIEFQETEGPQNIVESQVSSYIKILNI